MHTIWKGAISFGLVNIPVKMYAATEDKDISMRMLHEACGMPIAYGRTCPHCQTAVDNEAIVKGYEYEKGRFVRIGKEELDSLSAGANREIKIVDFVHLHEIDPIYFQKTYYLGPGDTGANAYGLLLAALQESGKIGIAQTAVRSKSSLAAIRIVDGCLSMETIFYPDEVRPAALVPNLQTTRTAVNEKELAMAKMLIDQLTVAFDPARYRDEYREQVMGLIQAKIAGADVHVTPEPRRTNVIDLMAALQASLQAAKPQAAQQPPARPHAAPQPQGAPPRTATQPTQPHRAQQHAAQPQVAPSPIAVPGTARKP